MHREALLACAPYLAAMLASAGLLCLVARLSGARLQVAHARSLHRDQQGGVQSLSFVLTLPVFVMILMFIVQLSQITIATVVIEYAAFAAARAAMVWIPAETADEPANQIGAFRQTGQSSDRGGGSYAVYIVDPSGVKYQKIHFAAAMACMPICPSRDTGTGAGHLSMAGLPSIERAYLAMSPAAANNTRVPARLANKLAYALNHTRVDIEAHHPLRVELGADAPLRRQPLELDRPGFPVEFAENEYGWQDQFYVTVSHDFALLPGPGRLLARRADARPGTPPETAPGTDRVAQSLARRGDVFVRTISATVRLNNEGQKSSLPYYQTLHGQHAPNFNDRDYEALEEYEEYEGDEANERGAEDQTADDDECCGAELSEEALQELERELREEIGREQQAEREQRDAPEQREERPREEPTEPREPEQRGEARPREVPERPLQETEERPREQTEAASGGVEEKTVQSRERLGAE